MADENINEVQEQEVKEQAAPEENGTNGNEEPDINELVKRIAELEVTNKRYKNSIDKSRSENKALKDQLRAKMTVDEQAEIDKKEAEERQKEYIASLEKFKNVAEAKARYALQGMSSDMAEQAANAEINGDMDELASIYKRHTEQVVKARESEWLKSRPQANVGGGGVTVTKEEFENMNMIERTKLFREHPDVYKALLNSK